jgi:opacity protein-like surface antigen
MFNRFRPFGSSLVVGLAGLVSMALPVAAADLDQLYGTMPQQMVTFGSGWYIRGDIGGTRGDSITAADMPYLDRFLGPGQQTPGFAIANTNNITYDASIGGGYQFNNYFRADVTGDYIEPIKSANFGTGRACVTGTQGTGPTPYQTEVYTQTTCTPQLSSSLESYAAFVNGYLDLGTYWIVTPYVGAGAGLSFGHASAAANYIQSNGKPYKIKYVDAINNQTYSQDWDRSVTTNYYEFAWALMAGLSFDVYQHTKLDIGYRYMDLGSVFGTPIKMQEVRAGLRYMIDN